MNSKYQIKRLLHEKGRVIIVHTREFYFFFSSKFERDIKVQIVGLNTELKATNKKIISELFCL